MGEEVWVGPGADAHPCPGDGEHGQHGLSAWSSSKAAYGCDRSDGGAAPCEFASLARSGLQSGAAEASPPSSAPQLTFSLNGFVTDFDFVVCALTLFRMVARECMHLPVSLIHAYGRIFIYLLSGGESTGRTPGSQRNLRRTCFL